ncbi:MAG TPA: hypothetical protein VH088_02965 [Terriglobales bacterium]|jgi:hypothetical protein|nr:hypothetical protein [Terriglobales bacterium]
MTTLVAAKIKVANEVWLAAALLHREHPKRPDFTIDEIKERAAKEAQQRELRPGVYVHIVQHCVANRPPNPARYRMLIETSEGHRRLFRDGDSYHSAREGGKTVPERDELPGRHQDLIDWYRRWRVVSAAGRIKNDPLLALRGSGKHIWADEHADVYIRRLREGWE